MRIFMLYWHDGKTEKITGKTISDAFTSAGYGISDIDALDWYEEVTPLGLP